MGKLTLLFVMVAVLGGSLLTFRAKLNSNETEFERRDVQGDLLARDAATSGHGLVLNAMLDIEGFRNVLGFSENDVIDGRFTVDNYVVATDRQTVDFTVTGHAGGSTHSVRSTYEWDPLDFPGPVWLDVPYATADIDPEAEIGGGPEALPTHFDDRRYHELQLHSLLPWNTMENNLAAEFGAAGGAGGTFQDSDMLASGYLADLNVADASELYYAAVGAMGMGDVTVAGPHTYSAADQNFGPSPIIVRITGGLTIDDVRVSGTGVLIVEGPVTMTGTSPELTWDGIVLIHSTDNYLPIEMGGTARVNITGSLVVDHLAVPPGGHLDLTTMRGTITGSWPNAGGLDSPIWDPYYPWYQHKHRFDHEVAEERTVYFAERGSDRHEAWTKFREILNELGSTPVYLEFINESNHGYATYTLDIDGQPQVYSGTVNNGFGLFSRSGDVHRTQNFNAGDLDTFIVDVLSLRMLKKRWDGSGGCEIWPICIGENWNRQGALTVRLRKASNSRRLYESSIYWHMRADEVEEHQADEQALRDLIESGAHFGTNLNFGPNVTINYDLDEIAELREVLGFDGDEIINTGTWTEHTTARDYRSQGVDAGVGGGPSAGHADSAPPSAPPPPPAPYTLICHAGFDVMATPAQLPAHLAHGDVLGSCGPPAPPDQMWVCHWSPPTEVSMLIPVADWPMHLAHSDWAGQCP